MPGRRSLPPMHGRLAGFAINADDLPATVGVYEQRFGWQLAEAHPDPGNVVGAIHLVVWSQVRSSGHTIPSTRVNAPRSSRSAVSQAV